MCLLCVFGVCVLCVKELGAMKIKFVDPLIETLY